MFSNVLLVLSSAFVKGRETATHIRTYIHYHTVNKSTKQLNTAATANFLITRQFQGLNAEPNRIAYGGAPFWKEKGSNDGTSSGSLGCSKRFQWILVPRATNAFLALRVCSWWSAMEPKMQTVNCKGSSINDVRSEGRGLAQMRTNADKGKGGLIACGRLQLSRPMLALLTVLAFLITLQWRLHGCGCTKRIAQVAITSDCCLWLCGLWRGADASVRCEPAA